MSKEYWIDGDGYIAYGRCADYEMVCRIDAIDNRHVQALTRILAHHSQLREACKMALKLLEDNQGEAKWYLKRHFNQLVAAIAAAEGGEK